MTSNTSSDSQSTPEIPRIQSALSFVRSPSERVQVDADSRCCEKTTLPVPLSVMVHLSPQERHKLFASASPPPTSRHCSYFATHQKLPSIIPHSVTSIRLLNVDLSDRRYTERDQGVVTTHRQLGTVPHPTPAGPSTTPPLACPSSQLPHWAITTTQSPSISNVVRNPAECSMPWAARAAA